MQDEPSLRRLLTAVTSTLNEAAVPALAHDPAVQFRVRIAAHLLTVVQRELAQDPTHIADELRELVAAGLTEPPATPDGARDAVAAGQRRLAERIRAGEPCDDALIERSLRRRLQVANPRFRLDPDLGEEPW